METETKTARVLDDLLRQTDMTPAELARRTYVSPGEVSNIKAGRRSGGRAWASAADDVLSADGRLVAAWDSDEDDRRLHRAIGAAAATADELLTLPDAADARDLQARAVSLGTEYLRSRSPGDLLPGAQDVQRELARRLKQRAYRERDLRDLQAAAGRVSGVLAYATLDLGEPGAAHKNATAAFHMGELAGMRELQAWARGTQSLIARFRKNYRLAEHLAWDGLNYASESGTAGIRCLAGIAQCRANLGDRDGALDLLDQAGKQRAERRPHDETGGLFTFSDAKQRYYGSSSLMWVSDRRALQRAVADADAAITMWRDGPDDSRAVADQALAHIYQSTAYARLGQLDEAMQAVAPVLGIPEEGRISWLRRRVGELAVHLSGGRYAGSAEAARAVDELRAWAA